MGLIKDRLNHILTFDLNDATRAALLNRDAQKKVIKFNQDQLLDGRGSDGAFLPQYAQVTLKKKPANLIPSSGSYSLKLSGSLHGKMFVEPGARSFKLSSRDARLTIKLQHGGGQTPPGKRVEENEAFGLTQENRVKLCNEILLPFYLKKLRGGK